MNKENCALNLVDEIVLSVVCVLVVTVLNTNPSIWPQHGHVLLWPAQLTAAINPNNGDTPVFLNVY